MIGDRVDVALCREQLRERGRAQVADYLQPPVAERLQECLAHEVPWTLAVRDGTGARTIEHAAYAAMDEAESARLLSSVADAKGEFRFAYESYMMVTAYQEGRDPDLALHRVLEVFNSPQYLAFVRELTGDPRIRRVNAQATRYRAGHFLRYHTDAESREGRLYAYVLNLTRDWQADWGGLLQFIDGEGRITDTFLPRWNTLSLFKVPTGHAVSLVAPWAEQDRMAITGWFLS
ncbi:2OG-Fe(II) oxygenase family protein [Lysobacter sp. LF1]|uniref:2OG-Fe(II) oxygenase family protein n=1 Tax=Lysobacter stagni TaxID=3045172 RepID=A0ABT6XCY7_9GAMM|nr:2OG-Fe(II) oxygenase family protein [Lysobacter sp. LF1]MDI9237999.1 2OG-Fe(II) oxygenase family protein [Lysobacter sp. LF1]